METGTFLNSDVQNHINRHFVPLKYESGADAEQFLRFGVKATPTFVILDSSGDEKDRIIGYYEPDNFIALLEKSQN